jgi:hypothetical protein
MQFLVPVFLISALAIAIPILVHLYWFRRFKPVYFTNVRFLREIKEETASRSRLRNLLVLLARILAVLALVAAFAQPFIPRGDSAASGPKAVGIYLDNSFSMTAQSRDVTLLELARMKARQIVEGYGPSDRFQILTNEGAGSSQRLVDREEALTLIDGVRPGPAVSPLATVLARQRQVLSADSEREPVSYLLSDFQEQSEVLPEWRDTLLPVYALQFQAVREQNVGIDSVWMEGPVLLARQANTLIVQVRNYGENPVEQVRLAMLEGGQEKPVASLNIPGGGVVFDTIVFTPQEPGWQGMEVFIQDHPVTFDDRYFLAGEVLDRLKVLVIHDQTINPFLQRGLQGISALLTSYQPSNRLDYEQFGDARLIILDALPELSSGLGSALQQYMASGGNVMVFPPARKGNLPGYPEFFSACGTRSLGAWEERERQVGRINTASFVFRDVYVNPGENLTLPATRGHYLPGSGSVVAEEILLTYRDGAGLINRYRQLAGNLYLSIAPLDGTWSDLGRSGEVFIPMLYRMALSGNQAGTLATRIGRDAEISLRLPPAPAGEVAIQFRGEDYAFIPRQRAVGGAWRFGLGTEPVPAGIYQVERGEGQLLGMVALNYDRRESVQQFIEPAALASLGFNIPDAVALADLSSWVGEKERGLVLWRWCVILALAFLGAEMLLLRFWKV